MSLGERRGAVLEQAVRYTDRLIGWVASAAAAIMVIVVVAEVVARYVLNSSLGFSNELSRLLFVWTMFLGLPMALSRGRHVGIQLVEGLFPAAIAKQVFRFVSITAGCLMIVVLMTATESMIDNWDQRLNVLPVSMSLFYAPMPIGAALSLFYLAVMAITAERVLIEDREGAEPL